MGNIKKQRGNKSKRNKKKQRKDHSTAQTKNSNLETEISQETTHEEQEVDVNEATVPQKREHSDNESDIEDKPKRKKKKKQHLPNEGNEQGKGKKSIRQMKREKFVQRQAEVEAVTKDALKQQCLSYLSQWKHARSQWKFMKAKQVWLYKNKFSSKLISDELWPLLLEYFESAKGNIRNMLLEDANKIIAQMEQCVETEAKADEELTEEMEPSASKPDEISYKRARDLIQHLQE